MPSAVRELRVFQAQDAVRRGGEGCDGTRERSERERNLCKKKSVLRLKERSPNVCPTRCFASNWIMGTLFSHTFPEKCTKNFIRILPGDRVKLEMSPYDLTKGRHPTGSSKPARRAPARSPRAELNLNPRGCAPRTGRASPHGFTPGNVFSRTPRSPVRRAVQFTACTTSFLYWGVHAKIEGRAPAEWCRPATSGTCAPSRCSCRWWDGPW